MFELTAANLVLLALSTVGAAAVLGAVVVGVRRMLRGKEGSRRLPDIQGMIDKKKGLEEQRAEAMRGETKLLANQRALDGKLAKSERAFEHAKKKGARTPELERLQEEKRRDENACRSWARVVRSNRDVIRRHNDAVQTLQEYIAAARAAEGVKQEMISEVREALFMKLQLVDSALDEVEQARSIRDDAYREQESRYGVPEDTSSEALLAGLGESVVTGEETGNEQVDGKEATPDQQTENASGEDRGGEDMTE